MRVSIDWLLSDFRTQSSDIHKRAALGVTVLRQDRSDPWPLPDGELDAAFTCNFPEHLPDKAAVSAVLSNAYRCLEPGGRLIAMGPEIKYLSGATGISSITTSN